MIGKIFSVFSIISVISAIACNNVKELCQGILDGASKGVNIAFSLMGMMVLWNGIMNVFKECGLISLLSKMLKPILKHIFPDSFKDNIATEEITACISANMLGISNAATPLAISAMKELDRHNKSKIATGDMITLTIIGCSCINLIPTTLLALRSSHMAEINYELILPIWLSSGTCMAFGIFLSRIASKIKSKNA